MIKLHFKRSKSKFLPEAVKTAGVFDVKVEDDGYTITPDIKKVFEHWEDFNKLFWLSVDWGGTYLEIDDMKYFSHRDKTGIFYSLQLSHAKWMNYVEMRTSKFFDNGEFNADQPISQKEADYLIDLYIIQKSQTDPF